MQTTSRMRSVASRGDVTALHGAVKDILEQGRAAEAAAVASWKKAESEAAAHRQGIEAMFARRSPSRRTSGQPSSASMRWRRPSRRWGP